MVLLPHGAAAAWCFCRMVLLPNGAAAAYSAAAAWCCCRMVLVLVLVLLVVLLLLLRLLLMLCSSSGSSYSSSSSSSNFLIYKIEAAVDAAPAIFGRYLVTLWRQQLAAADAFGYNIGYNLDDKAVFPQAKYNLLCRYRNPVRGTHLSSGDNYAALIFNWVI